jgi:hypothetical protein
MMLWLKKPSAASSFPSRRSSVDKVQALIDIIPGAEAAIAASERGAILSRLMGGGLMAVGTRWGWDWG